MKQWIAIVGAICAVAIICVGAPAAGAAPSMHSCPRFTSKSPMWYSSDTGYYEGFARIRSSVGCPEARTLIAEAGPAISYHGQIWRFVGYQRTVWKKTIWKQTRNGRLGSTLTVERGGELTDGTDVLTADSLDLRECSTLSGVARSECFPITFASYGGHL